MARNTAGRYDLVIVGSGDETTDTENMTAAAAVANANGKGTIWIDGEVYLNDVITFSAPISLRGTHTTSVLGSVDNLGRLVWGSLNYSPWASGVAFTATTALQEYVVDPGLSLARGDWFFAWSEDTLTGLTSLTGYTNSPGEVHQVSDVRTANCYFDDFIVDALTTNPKIVKLNMITGFVVADLTFGWRGTTQPSNNWLNLRQCSNVVMENLYWAPDGPNDAFFLYCGNVRCQGWFIDHKRSYNNGTGYGVVTGACNDFLFCDSKGYGCRHVFTTGGQANGTKITGTPRNVVVDNITCGGNGNDADVGDGATASSLVPLDTHGEGWGITFQNCNVAAPADTVNRAIQTRARNTIIRNCTLIGGSTTGAHVQPQVYLMSTGNEVYGNLICNGWRGIEVRHVPSGGTTDHVNNNRIYNNHIDGTNGPAITILNGSGHIISNNVISNCGAATSSSGGYNYSRSAIQFFNADSGHRVVNNDICKYSTNLYSVDGGPNQTNTTVMMAGNSCDGYTPGTLGVTGTNAAAIEAAYLARNWHD